nr:rod-binding protein [Allorhizobium sonneratiae]
MDVVKAADQSSLAEAQQKLQTIRASARAADLNSKSAGFEVAMNTLNSDTAKAGLANRATNSIKVKDIPKPYREYEGVVLQNFISNMLPKDSEALYGKGSAGEIWRSMMAEQIGNTIANRGGIGIAKQMYAEELAKMRGHAVQNSSTSAADKNMAQMRLDQIERKALALKAPDQDQQQDQTQTANSSETAKAATV